MAETRKRVGAGVIALSLFGGWMWHAAEVNTPGITAAETNRAASAAGGAAAGAINGGRTAAQQAGLDGLLTPPATDPTASGQLGGVAGGQ